MAQPRTRKSFSATGSLSTAKSPFRVPQIINPPLPLSLSFGSLSPIGTVMGSSVPRFPVVYKSISVDIKGNKTDVVLCSYDDHFLVIASQIGAMGTILHARLSFEICLFLHPRKEEGVSIEPTFNVSAIFGKRDEPMLLACARQLIEQISISGSSRPLVLSLGLKDHSAETLKGIVSAVTENRLWIWLLDYTESRELPYKLAYKRKTEKKGSRAQIASLSTLTIFHFTRSLLKNFLLSKMVSLEALDSGSAMIGRNITPTIECKRDGEGTGRHLISAFKGGNAMPPSKTHGHRKGARERTKLVF
ncbi:Proteasome assembly chaperone 3 [Morella rubra]|uniref:Proteasome assembly chaperone 3 n=1 Tax=Morella rubra TaxID=262757 RepID=A0A6A1VBC5_9ROSI|nr:Proteasome assembly chaperone 3 [Morella rubra]